ncbi:MAG: hypothetical protein IPM01_28360 [Burkholderiaceae bacterium]|nr:hypothetical protein [Burkholderiaceae bacterium]
MRDELLVNLLSMPLSLARSMRQARPGVSQEAVRASAGGFQSGSKRTAFTDAADNKNEGAWHSTHSATGATNGFARSECTNLSGTFRCAFEASGTSRRTVGWRSVKARRGPAGR